MTQPRRRKAKVSRTLVFYDEPQLLLLRQAKMMFLAVAVPCDEGSRFLATTVNAGDWELYMADRVDLQYLFVYPVKRILYYFDLLEAKDGEVMMERFEGIVPQRHLPAAHFFASDHTELSEVESELRDIETLYLEGEWELPELGRFQQKFSDVYTFLYSLGDWRAAAFHTSDAKEQIRAAFTKRPFRGGSSYGAYFSDLEKRLSIKERVSLRSIQKASPGNMKIEGNQEVFKSVHKIVVNYLSRRNEVHTIYGEIYKELQQQELLARSVSNYSHDDETVEKLNSYSEKLLNSLALNCDRELTQITSGNALGKLKIALAICRRIESASKYFAQGRASFEDPKLRG